MPKVGKAMETSRLWSPMPDPIMGERACAYIETKPGARLTFEDVIAFLKEQKAAVIQLPERIEFIEKIPLTKAAKLDKQALRKDIESKLKVETPDCECRI